MTSSLVGSEMCIRDRPQPTARGGSEARHHSDRRTDGSHPTQQLRTTVSYTHLTLPTICSV
eukprot:5740674-Prorocentrum_lima.AAC.1